MIKIHDVEQGSPEWFELRKDRVTGSVAHILLERGLNEAIRANSKSFNGNFWTERGKILENEAIQLYKEIRQIDVMRAGFVTNDLYPEAGYSPDGIAGERLIEIKCFSKKHGNLTFPILAQTHFGLMICELQKADVVFYNPEEKPEKALIIHTINRNERIINNIKKKLEKHYENTKAN